MGAPKAFATLLPPMADDVGFRAIVVLITFSLHNGWNCWSSMNFVNFSPVQALLEVDEPTVGIINACGWLGILCAVPIVVGCQRPRVLLLGSGVLNVLPAALRYYGALHRDWRLVALSNFLNNAAFGAIGSWPAMLASSQWPERHRSLVISIASLSERALNYRLPLLPRMLLNSLPSKRRFAARTQNNARQRNHAEF